MLVRVHSTFFRPDLARDNSMTRSPKRVAHPFCRRDGEIRDMSIQRHFARLIMVFHSRTLLSFSCKDLFSINAADR